MKVVKGLTQFHGFFAKIQKPKVEGFIVLKLFIMDTFEIG